MRSSSSRDARARWRGGQRGQKVGLRRGGWSAYKGPGERGQAGSWANLAWDESRGE